MASLLSMLTACGGSGGGGTTVSAAPPATGTAPPTTAPVPAPAPAPVPAPVPAPAPVSTIPANLVTTVPAFVGSDTDRTAAYTQLNAVRNTCGFGLLAQNTQLETAAQNHANYIGVNYVAHSDAFSHTENLAYLSATGVLPSDRATAVGYGSQYIGEDLALFTTTANVKVDGLGYLLQAGYHLLSLTGFRGYDMGISSATVSPAANQASPNLSAVAVELGSKNSTLQDVGSTDISTYPCAGLSIKVSSAGIARESPEPLPGRDYVANPVGQPIYIHVRAGQMLTISSVTMATPTGTVVGQAALLTNANDPNHIVGVNEALYYPNVLASGTQYTVTIVGTNNGTAFNKTFVFSTV